MTEVNEMRLWSLATLTFGTVGIGLINAYGIAVYCTCTCTVLSSGDNQSVALRTASANN